MSNMEALFESAVASGELASAAKDADLIPSGKYPFDVAAVTYPEQKDAYTDGNANPLFGHPVGRVEVTLYGVGAKGYDPLDGRNRKHFFSITPAQVKDSQDRLIGASRLAGYMIAVSGTAGRPFSETMQWFTANKAEISIGQFKRQNGETGNSTQRIGKLL